MRLLQCHQAKAAAALQVEKSSSHEEPHLWLWFVHRKASKDSGIRWQPEIYCSGGGTSQFQEARGVVSDTPMDKEGVWEDEAPLGILAASYGKVL